MWLASLDYFIRTYANQSDLFNYTRFITMQLATRQSNEWRPVYENFSHILQNENIKEQIAKKFYGEPLNGDALLYFPTLIKVLDQLNIQSKELTPLMNSFNAIIGVDNIDNPEHIRVMKIDDLRYLFVNKTSLNEYLKLIIELFCLTIQHKLYVDYYLLLPNKKGDKPKL